MNLNSFAPLDGARILPLLVASHLGFEIVGEEVNSAKELYDAFNELWRQIDCFFIIPDSCIYSANSVEYLLIEAFKKTIPIIGLSSSYTKAGALISSECDYEKLGEQAAVIALNILNGKDPSEIGYIEPEEINFSLNMTVARRLGIEFSPEVIREASEVFGE
jgi:putative ABC transport system substrate-binding protein